MTSPKDRQFSGLKIIPTQLTGKNLKYGLMSMKTKKDMSGSRRPDKNGKKNRK